MPVNSMTVVTHLGFLRRSRRGRALKLDIDPEAFLMADRYVRKDGNEWVNMVVSVENVLGVLEGTTETVGISQLEKPVARPGVEEAEGNESHV